MEDKILDELKKEYDFNEIILDVKFIEFRSYRISIFINSSNYVFFDYKYDSLLTFESNLYTIISSIDKYILKFYKRRK